MDYKREVLNLSERMRLLHLDKNNIKVQAKYGPSKATNLPLKINSDLSCFIATVIGDGHLIKDKFTITVESSNIDLLYTLSSMVNELFQIKTSIKKIKKRDGKKQTYHLSIYSKAIQELLSLIFEIPRGKKSAIVKVPSHISASKDEIKKAFIIGLLAAEGSRKGNNEVRICSASKRLVEDTKNLLKDLKVDSNIESWTNKKYKKDYYSLSFDKYHLDTFMRGCRSGQTGLILSIFKKVIENQA